MEKPTLPLWQEAGWPAEHLGAQLKSWNTSGGQRTVIVTLDAEPGGCAVYCRGAARDDVRAFLGRSKLEGMTMKQVFVGLEQWRAFH